MMLEQPQREEKESKAPDGEQGEESRKGQCPNTQGHGWDGCNGSQLVACWLRTSLRGAKLSQEVPAEEAPRDGTMQTARDLPEEKGPGKGDWLSSKTRLNFRKDYRMYLRLKKKSGSLRWLFRWDSCQDMRKPKIERKIHQLRLIQTNGDITSRWCEAGVYGRL